MPFARRRPVFPVILIALLVLAGADTGEEPAVDPALDLMMRLDRLLSFIEWPADAFAGPESPLVIGVVGLTPFSPEALARCTVGGRSIRMERLDEPDTTAGCHVLWVGDDVDHSRWATPGTTLTVSSREGFVGGGGMVELHPGASPELDLGALGRTRLAAHPHLVNVSEVRR